VSRLIAYLEQVQPYDLHAHPLAFIAICLAGVAAGLWLVFYGSTLP
jgi:hypothetical protein